MLRNAALLKILGPAIVFGMLFGVFDYADQSPTQIPPFSWGRLIIRSLLAGGFGAFVGFVYWLSTMKDDTSAPMRKERVRFVSNTSFDVTREDGMVYLDYMSESKAKFWLLTVVFVAMTIGGCVVALKADLMGGFLVYGVILLGAYLLLGRATTKTITIKPGDYVEGEFSRIGLEFVSLFTHRDNCVCALSRGAEIKITSRLKTHTLASAIADALNSNVVHAP